MRPVFTVKFIAACIQVDLLDICHFSVFARFLNIIVFLMSQLNTTVVPPTIPFLPYHLSIQILLSVLSSLSPFLRTPFDHRVLRFP